MTTSAADSKARIRELLHKVTDAANEALIKFDDPRLVGSRCVDIHFMSVDLMTLLGCSDAVGLTFLLEGKEAAK